MIGFIPHRPSRWLLAFLGLSSWAILAGLALRNLRSEQRLSAQAAELREQIAQLYLASTDHTRIARELASFGNLEALRHKSQQARQLHESIDRLRLTLHNLELAKPLPGEAMPDPVWPDGARVVEAKEWAFVGKNSPEDALESVLWAGANSDVGRLAELITFQGAAQAKAQELFDRLPEQDRANYGNPQKIIATMIAASMPTDLSAASFGAQQYGTLAMASVRTEQSDGKQSDLTLRVDQVSDGWRLDVPVEVIDGFQKKLMGTQ